LWDVSSGGVDRGVSMQLARRGRADGWEREVKRRGVEQLMVVMVVVAKSARRPQVVACNVRLSGAA
jgi:hypothetical protein